MPWGQASCQGTSLFITCCCMLALLITDCHMQYTQLGSELRHGNLCTTMLFGDMWQAQPAQAHTRESAEMQSLGVTEVSDSLCSSPYSSPQAESSCSGSPGSPWPRKGFTATAFSMGAAAIMAVKKAIEQTDEKAFPAKSYFSRMVQLLGSTALDCKALSNLQGDGWNTDGPNQ